MRAIEHLGYRPSAAARSMVSSRTQTLAMLVPHLSDPNFGVIVAGAERQARQQGYSLMVADFDTVTASNLLTEHRVDGILLIEPRRFTKWLQSVPGLPCVATDDVPMDNLNGGRAVGQHLQALGHQRVTMVGGPANSIFAALRHQGLNEIFPDAHWIPGDWTAQSGYNLLAVALESKPSAIFAANDFIALGVMRAAHERGLEIPSKLSVVGFDDSPLAPYFHPPLTTVRQPLEWQGSRAVELLLAQLSNQPMPEIEPQPLEFIVRQSTSTPFVTPSTGSPRHDILGKTHST